MKANTQKERLRKVLTDILDDMPEINLVYLFGSQVEESAGPISDYDLGVLIERNQNGPQVRSQLSIELAQRIKAESFDIVLLNRVPIELAYAVIAYGELLYQQDDAMRVEYEARVMGLYFDYLPVLRSQRSDILKGGEYGSRIQRYRKAFRRTERTLGQIRTSQE
jgi:predicted nucleotidyltransferase